ncbi:hypothetical protein CXK86_31635 [Paenibacillus sp. BGI2013]|uniref:hypothetical protein n=1 Tax=Paenibacillus sp. BGI2013 TaxID=2058902 RepID=UPI000C6D08A9|nr:hypothetical protein [Paenibacillus sp. BGI2013]PKQ87200.1 hypothetical protein CXK86_31635 [Paenibacillus sp. BGI2013]
MNKSRLGNAYLKKTVIILGMFLLYFPLFLVISLLLFGITNIVDPGAYYRYATESKYSEDVFFSPEIDAKTKIGNTITKTFIVMEKDLPDNTQAMFHELLTEESSFLSQLKENKAYMDYLVDNNLTLEELITYMKSISNLSNEILNGSLYFSAVIIFIIVYILFRFRLELYWLAGILYVFSNLDGFTSGIFSNIFYNPMRWASMMIGQEYTINQYNMYIEFLPKIKEAFLTFIIFDTVGQIYREKWEKKRLKKLTEIYFSLGGALNFLRDLRAANSNNPFIKITKVNIDLYYLSKYASKKRNDIALKEVRELTIMFLRRIESSSISVDDVIRFLERLIVELNGSEDFKNKINLVTILSNNQVKRG